MASETTIKIEDLCDWSAPKRVQTRNGPRNLRTATAGDKFWAAWKTDKASLKDAGVSVSKSRSGAWEACWWLPLTTDERSEVESAIESSRATDADIEIPVPEGLSYLPYQRAGIAYAASRPTVLIGDEMGLGKTIQAIGIWNSDASLETVLIVCPSSLRLNWAREFTKWSVRPVSIAVVQGGKPSDWTSCGADAADVVIVNYDILKKHRAAVDARTWDLLVTDECHYLKNPKAIRTKAVLGDGKDFPAIAARRRAFLTGTPIVNRPVELFPLLGALDPDRLGRNFFAYAKKYCNATRNRFGWDFTGASNLDELQQLMRERFMVRRLKADVLTELPAKRRQVLEIPANGAAKAVKLEVEAFRRYEETLADLAAYCELAKAMGQDEYDEAVARYQAAQKVAFEEISAARREVAEAKVEKVIEHLEACLEEGNPIVVFAHHKSVISKIRDAFPGSVGITGDTPLSDRQEAVDAFQEGRSNLFVGNIQAAGVGITLVRSSHVVFAELDWVPGNMSQAEDRCHRIGQTESVLVQHIVLEGSLDANMAQKLVAKQEVIDRALDRQTSIDWESSPKEEVATATVTVKQVEDVAAKLTDEQVAASHTCLRILARMCDGAQELDGMGFSKFDARVGHSLASQESLTKRQGVLAIKLANKYRRQLPAELLAIAKGGE